MKFGTQTVSKATVALIVILSLSTIAGGYLVTREVTTGGMEVAWTYRGQDAFGHPSNDYDVISVSENGTIYAQERLRAWTDYRTYCVALNPDSSLWWRFGYNGFVWPTIGANGWYYVVGTKNATDWEDGFGDYLNLTAIDGNGHYRWSFVADNGTLELWATYPEGTVIANHYNFANYNLTTQMYDDYINEAIAIGSNGQVLWRKAIVPMFGTGYTHPTVGPNGTFLVYTFDPNNNTSIEIGFDKSTGASYAIAVDYTPGEPANGPNGLSYNVRSEYINSTTTIVSVFATYPSNGTVAWRTVLAYKDNPFNYTGGQEWAAFSDGEIIYAMDDEGKTLSALSPDGILLWQKPYPGWITAAYSSGGVLLRDMRSISKINSDGSLAWRYELNHDNVAGWNAVVGPNGTVYFAGTNSIVALSRSSFSTNLQLLTVLLVFDAAVVVGYLWKRSRPVR